MSNSTICEIQTTVQISWRKYLLTELVSWHLPTYHALDSEQALSLLVPVQIKTGLPIIYWFSSGSWSEVGMYRSWNSRLLKSTATDGLHLNISTKSVTYRQISEGLEDICHGPPLLLRKWSKCNSDSTGRWNRPVLHTVPSSDTMSEP